MCGTFGLESHAQPEAYGAADLVAVDVDAVAIELLIFLIILAEQVAGLELDLRLPAEEADRFARDEVQPQPGLLDNVGLARAALDRAAFGHALAGIGEEEGRLRQPVAILDSELDVGEVV